MIANLYALTNQYLYQFNNTSKSYPGAQNTCSIVYSFRWWWLLILLRWTIWSIYWRASPLISQYTSSWCTERVDAYLVYWTRKHAVSTTGAIIIQLFYKRLYLIFKDKLLVIKKYINKYLNKGFIYFSIFLIAIPIFLTKKLRGGIKFYINYKVLNTIIIKNSYPILFIYKTFKQFS